MQVLAWVGRQNKAAIIAEAVKLLTEGGLQTDAFNRGI
jgi:hypothetical protein